VLNSIFGTWIQLYYFGMIVSGPFSCQFSEQYHQIVEKYRIQLKGTGKNDQCPISIYMDVGSFYFCLCGHRWFLHIFTLKLSDTRKVPKQGHFPKFVHSTLFQAIFTHFRKNGHWSFFPLYPSVIEIMLRISS